MGKRRMLALVLCLLLPVLSGCRSEIAARRCCTCGETHAGFSIELAWACALDFGGAACDDGEDGGEGDE